MLANTRVAFGSTLHVMSCNPYRNRSHDFQPLGHTLAVDSYLHAHVCIWFLQEHREYLDLNPWCTYSHYVNCCLRLNWRLLLELQQKSPTTFIVLPASGNMQKRWNTSFKPSGSQKMTIIFYPLPFSESKRSHFRRTCDLVSVVVVKHSSWLILLSSSYFLRPWTHTGSVSVQRPWGSTWWRCASVGSFAQPHFTLFFVSFVLFQTKTVTFLIMYKCCFWRGYANK